MTQREQRGQGLADPAAWLVRTRGHHFPWESSGLILLDPQPLIAASGLEQGAATAAAPLRALGLCLHPIAARRASSVPLNWQRRCQGQPFAAVGPAVPPRAGALPLPGWVWVQELHSFWRGPVSPVLCLIPSQGRAAPATACPPLPRVLVVTPLALTLSLEASHILSLVASALPGLSASLLLPSPTLQCLGKPHKPSLSCPAGDTGAGGRGQC